MPEKSPNKPDLPKKGSDHQPQKSWVSTAEMASWLSMHEKTLLKYLRDQRSPFQETRDFRRLSLSNKGPVQWHLNNAENTFSTFKRIDPSSVETYGADAANGLKDSKKGSGLNNQGGR